MPHLHVLIDGGDSTTWTAPHPLSLPAQSFASLFTSLRSELTFLLKDQRANMLGFEGHTDPVELFNGKATICSMWDLSSLTRDQTNAPVLEVQSLNHWTAKEVLLCLS